MSDALVILHAREVKPAHRAFHELPIAKIWLSGYTEQELAGGVFNYAIEESNFDRYLVCADDILVRPQALEAVIKALDEGCEVATGYSQRSHTDMTVNVTSGPLADSWPTVEAYNFRQLQEVVSWPEPLVPTWFAGFSLTGMDREMWRRFGFGCFVDPGTEGPGYASDFFLSRALQKARVPISAVREAFCYHWRHSWEHTNDPRDDRVLIGEMTQQVTIQEPVLV